MRTARVPSAGRALAFCAESTLAIRAPYASASSATVPDMMREAFQKQVQQNLDKLAVKRSENGKNEDDPEPTTFEIKEPLVADEKLGVASRTTVATDFTDRGAWAKQLAAASFDAAVPTVWILEGLLMYLSLRDTEDLMRQIGELSAPGSVVFHDAVSANYVAGGRGPVVGGAPFIGGSDDYKGMWREHAGFGKGYARDFSSIKVDRAQRKLRFDDGVAEATPARCRGNSVVLFVVAQK